MVSTKAPLHNLRSRFKVFRPHGDLLFLPFGRTIQSLPLFLWIRLVLLVPELRYSPIMQAQGFNDLQLIPADISSAMLHRLTFSPGSPVYPGIPGAPLSP